VASDGKLEKRTVPAAGASANRLSALFDLRLDGGGVLSGTVKITARRAWKTLLFPPRLMGPRPSGGDTKLLSAFLREFFPQTLRYSDIQVRETGRDGEALVTLSGIQAITDTGGRGILVSVPSLLPRCFNALRAGPLPYTLNFPFVFEARITLALPSNTESVALPAPAEGGAEKVKYSVSYKLGKKKVLTAEARITVGTTTVTDSVASSLNAAFQAWQTFMTKNLPIRLKPGP
jgi:hypothetical protein